jgi:hypothetical protein
LSVTETTCPIRVKWRTTRATSNFFVVELSTSLMLVAFVDRRLPFLVSGRSPISTTPLSSNLSQRSSEVSDYMFLVAIWDHSLTRPLPRPYLIHPSRLVGPCPKRLPSQPLCPTSSLTGRQTPAWLAQDEVVNVNRCHHFDNACCCY